MIWPIVSLKDVAINIVDGPFGSSLKTSDYVDEGIPVLQGKNITGNKFKYFDVRYITEKKAETIKRSSVRVGDHLLVKIGSIGYSAIIDNLYGHEFAIIPANLAKITPDPKLIDSRYLDRYLTSINAIRYFQKIASKTAQPALSLSKIKNLEVPLPPLEEQRRIAAILDKADELRQKRQQAIEKLDQLLKATFIDMFGDPVSNPKGWPVKKLKDLSIKIHSGNTPKGGSENYVEKGITFIRSQNVWKNKIILDDVAYIDAETHAKMLKSSVKHEDILMTKTGRINTDNSSLGRAAIYLGADDSANINGHVYLIRIKKEFNKYFILNILTLPDYYEYIRSVCVGGIDKRQLNKEHLENFPIILPPSELQQKYSEIVKVIENQKSILYKQLEIQENLFKALQNKAFSGTL